MSNFFSNAISLRIAWDDVLDQALRGQFHRCSTILGIGATKRVSAVRWGIAGRIVTAWVVTIPACIALGWGIYSLLHLLTQVRYLLPPLKSIAVFDTRFFCYDSV
jgi:hypothetical protein